MKHRSCASYSRWSATIIPPTIERTPARHSAYIQPYTLDTRRAARAMKDYRPGRHYEIAAFARSLDADDRLLPARRGNTQVIDDAGHHARRRRIDA